MKTDQTFYREHKNVGIWITASRPLILGIQGEPSKESDQWAVAFKFHGPPVMLDGEYLKDGSKGKWFQTAEEAAHAAFEAACEKIDAHSAPLSRS